MNDPVRIFIGSSSNGEDSEIEAVYEWSLRKNTKRALDITWMRQTTDASSFWWGFNTPRWSTPFSGFRWAIPEACNFKGRAIYTDTDMINFRDIGDLIDVDLKGKPFSARRGKRFGGHEFCVMVIDCAAAGEVLSPVSRQRSIAEYHHRCINQFTGNDKYVEDLDPRWNCLDGEDRPIEDIWQLHWTNMATQPWKPKWFTGVPLTHPRQDLVELFRSMQTQAAQDGYPLHRLVNDSDVVHYNIIGR